MVEEQENKIYNFIKRIKNIKRFKAPFYKKLSNTMYNWNWFFGSKEQYYKWRNYQKSFSTNIKLMK